MENFITRIQEHFLQGARLKTEFVKTSADQIESFALLIGDALKDGKKILICGNGGSAADSQHFAAEMVGRLVRERDALPAIALSTDTSIMTALSNDYGVEQVFRRQIAALGQSGDVLFAISTSGNSANVIAAVETAKDKNMQVFSLLGKDGGALAGKSDHAIVVPSSSSQFIQEIHISIIHILCELIEDIVCPI